MLTKNFPEINISAQGLTQILNEGQNLLLIGEHGVGKTQRILDCFKENNMNYVYFSAPTMDPHIQLIGVPKEGDDGKLHFLRPENINESLEVIFIDELNRAGKDIRNAVLELVQFKAINGKKLPNLKAVWASINPDDDTHQYDVEPIDPALMDRFEILINVPNDPCPIYFGNKFGEKGELAVDWYKDQPLNAQKQISPRRLEYAVQGMEKELLVDQILPLNSNVLKFKEYLSLGKEYVLKRRFEKNPCLSTYNNIVDFNNLDLIKSMLNHTQDKTKNDFTQHCFDYYFTINDSIKEIMINQYFEDKDFSKTVHQQIVSFNPNKTYKIFLDLIKESHGKDHPVILENEINNIFNSDSTKIPCPP